PALGMQPSGNDAFAAVGVELEFHLPIALAILSRDLLIAKSQVRHDETALGIGSALEMAIEKIVGHVADEGAVQQSAILIDHPSAQRSSGLQDHRTKVAAAGLLDVKQT